MRLLVLNLLKLKINQTHHLHPLILMIILLWEVQKRLFKKIQTLINLLSVTHKKDSLSPIFLFINIFLVNIYKSVQAVN